MKKIGILHGKERSFPQALVDRINAMKEPGITAEEVLINQVRQGEATPYAVILDRISQDVPFYRAYLKNAVLNGTAVVNNPFWWSAERYRCAGGRRPAQGAPALPDGVSGSFCIAQSAQARWRCDP